jgi:predicted RNA-binding Zn ribbon-like protein
MMRTSEDSPMPADFQFDLDAGVLCLDFVNTLSSTSGEHLNVYADLVAFAAQSHLLTPADAEWLRAEGERDPVAAQGVVRRAQRLRARLYNIFSALADGKHPAERDVEGLNAELTAAASHARVQANPHGDGFSLIWSGRNFDAPLWPISRSAADLLISDEDRRRVRECGGSDCKWLFLDTSKNRSRQWCSMQSCGNREKARRHYQRVRQVMAESTAESAAERPGRRPARRTSAGRAGAASATVD